MLGENSKEESLVNFEILNEKLVDILSSYTGTIDEDLDLIASEMILEFRDAYEKDRKWLVGKVLDMCGEKKIEIMDKINGQS